MQALIAVIVAFIVAAAVLWFFFAPRKAFRARVDNGVQEAVVEVKGGYSPAIIEAEAGLPLRLIFDRKRKTVNARRMWCSPISVSTGIARFPHNDIDASSLANRGSTVSSCAMNMLHGTLRVVARKKHHAAMAKRTFGIGRKIRNIAEISRSYTIAAKRCC